MALKATIYKAMVNVADMDRHRYLDATLTLAPISGLNWVFLRIAVSGKPCD